MSVDNFNHSIKCVVDRFVVDAESYNGFNFLFYKTKEFAIIVTLVDTAEDEDYFGFDAFESVPN